MPSYAPMKNLNAVLGLLLVLRITPTAALMDLFEKKLLEVRTLPPFERENTLAKYRSTCKYPNHNTCANSKHEWFYCFTGRSFLGIDFERSLYLQYLSGCTRDGIETRIFLHSRYRDSTTV